jgi:hypothetical protein
VFIHPKINNGIKLWMNTLKADNKEIEQAAPSNR